MASSQSDRIVIDPTGDALITLDNAGAVFAVWSEPLDTASDSGETTTDDTREELCSEDGGDREELPGWMKWDEAELEHNGEEQPQQQHDLPAPSTTDTWIQKTLVSSTTIDPVEPRPSIPIMAFQVSSAHLATASPEFRSELQSSKNRQEDNDGLLHMGSSNWDPEAFEILLNTLHTRYRRVPKQLTLEMLAKVAVMVEHYQCWEAFELISQTWIKHARWHHPVPLTYDRDLVLWMLIAWVFKLPKEFTKTTALALRQCTESSIRDMGLEIPSSILRTLETQRSEVIEQLVETFHCWIDEFSDTYTCRVDTNLSFECSSMLLGALMKQMRNVGVLSPAVVAPFDGFSIENVYESIMMLKSPIWETYDEINELYPIKHACGFQGTIIRDVEHVLARLKGLSLDDFMECSEDAEELVLRCP